MLPGGGETSGSALSFIMPDYLLVFAVAVLTHDQKFTSHTGNTIAKGWEMLTVGPAASLTVLDFNYRYQYRYRC